MSVKSTIAGPPHPQPIQVRELSIRKSPITANASLLYEIKTRGIVELDPSGSQLMPASELS
jgi:hypothetical protein